MAKELAPSVIGCAVWGPLLVKKDTELKCDNQGLVDAINKGSSRDKMVMHLLRWLFFYTSFSTSRLQLPIYMELTIAQQICCQGTKQSVFLRSILWHLGHQHHYHLPYYSLRCIPVKIRLDLPSIPETLQRNNCNNTAMGIRTLTNYQPFLEQCC